MNFELIIKLIVKNFNRFKSKKVAQHWLSYEIYWYKWRVSKLKLGKIDYFITYDEINGVAYNLKYEMKHVRQDTTAEDEKKPENILKEHFSWKWESEYIGAAIVIVSWILWNIYKNCANFFYEHFGFLLHREERYEIIVRYLFKSIAESNLLSSMSKWESINYMLMECLTEFCLYFNILF